MNNKCKKIILTFLLLVVSVFTLTSCQNEQDENNNGGSAGGQVQVTTYTLSFETNGGSILKAEVIQENEKVALADYVPTKTNYTFEAWYSDINLTQKVTEVTMNKNITVYAGYTENKFKVYFESNGGSEVEPIEAYRGTILKGPENPTKEGYVFEGWYRDEELTLKYEFIDNSFMHAEDLTLYAKWEEEKVITISYVGIEKEDTKLVGIEGVEVEEFDSEIAGYVFEGYYQDIECTEEYTFELYPSDNQTVYAKYHLLNTNVTLTYVVDGKTVNSVTSLKELEEAEEFKPEYHNEEEAEYFYFDSWYLDEKYTEKFDGIVPSVDTTLYARFIRSSKYVKVSFEGSDNSYYVKKGEIIPEEYFSEITVGEGLVFDGYVTKEGLTFNPNEAAYRDMVLSPNVYSEGLQFEPVYIDSTDDSGNTIQIVSGYAVCGYISDTSYDNLVIPNCYNGYRVIKISDNAFNENNNIINVVLPSNVEEIGAYAFADSSLKTIELSESLTTINDSAFLNCRNLEKVVYKTYLEEVGYQVFEGSQYLDSLRSLNEGGIYIGLDNHVIYEYNRNLVYKLSEGSKAVFGNKGATIVAGGAFEGISQLAHVQLPNTIVKIGKYAFKDCTGLEELVITSELSIISEGAFMNTKALKYFDVIDSITEIGDEAFRYSGLEEVRLGLYLDNYGKYVFADCESLTNVVTYVYSLMTSISEGMFYGCTSLIGFVCTDNIETIEQYAFANCTALKTVYLGYSQNTKMSLVEAHAFDACYALKHIYILRIADVAGNIMTIEEYAFPITNAEGEPAEYHLYVPNTTYSRLDFEGTYQEYYISKLPEMYDAYVQPYDTSAPKLTTYISTYQLEPSSAVDVYDLLMNGEFFDVTDDVTAKEDLTLVINYVRLNNTINLSPLEDTETVFDMSAGGTYVISFSIVDEFGNQVNSSLIVNVSEKEL